MTKTESYAERILWAIFVIGARFKDLLCRAAGTNMLNIIHYNGRRYVSVHRIFLREET